MTSALVNVCLLIRIGLNKSANRIYKNAVHRAFDVLPHDSEFCVGNGNVIYF